MKVSIVIPCYNVDRYIEECLDSVYVQTFQEIEVIAVDNNSTDSTLDKLYGYKEKIQNDLIVLTEKTKGAPAARNKGLSKAKGEWVQFLDADDLLVPTKLEHQINLIGTNKSKHLFVAGAYRVLKLDGIEEEDFVLDSDPILACFKKELGITSSNLWTKKALLHIDGWNEKLKSSQEADLMFRLIKKGTDVIIDNEPLTIIRQREFGQISNNSVENQLRFLDLRIEIFNYIKKNQASLFDKEAYMLHNTLYCLIRFLSRSDRKKAAYYYKCIPKDFYPNENYKVNLYKRLLDVFGFERIEYLRQYLSKLSV